MVGEPVRLAGDSRSRYRFIARAVVFSVGVCMAAAAVGAALALIGGLVLAVHELAVAITAVAVSAALGRELFGMPIPIPHRRWQVPRTWGTRFWLGALGFGAVMGAGFFTYTQSLVFYLYLVACLLSGSGWEGGAFGLAYGLCFTSAVFLSGAAWRRILPAMQAREALALGRKAGFVGALSSPLLFSLSAVWWS